MSLKSNVRIYGNVQKNDVETIRRIILELYSSLGDAPPYVEISFFENASFIEEVNSREAKTIKQILSIEPTLFSTNHPISSHAWFNYPSIGINMDQFSMLPRNIKIAWLERTAANTILHRTLDSYNIQKPLLFFRLKSFNFLDKQIIDFGFKLFLAAIYEYETSNYLTQKYTLANQIDYYLYYLNISPEDKKGVLANKQILDIQFLTLLSRFMYLFGVMPIYLKTKHKGIHTAIEENLHLFPYYVYNDIWQLLRVYLPMLTFDTQKNLDFLLPRLIWIIRKIDKSIED